MVTGQGLRSLKALSKQVKVLRIFNQQLSAGLDGRFVRSEGPEGHFTAAFILTNGRLTGQQVFWNGSGTGKCPDFRSFLAISATGPVGGTFQFLVPALRPRVLVRQSPRRKTAQ